MKTAARIGKVKPGKTKLGKAKPGKTATVKKIRGKASEAAPQTAAARRAVEAEVGALIAALSPMYEPLAAALRRALRKRLPTAHEMVYEYRDCVVISYSPSGHGHEGVLGIRASAEGVRLFFNGGKGLADPEKLLQGSGGQVRWIAVEAAATLRRPAVASLMDEAIARNRVPFAASGRGPLVVRPTTAAKKKGERKRA